VSGHVKMYVRFIGIHFKDFCIEKINEYLEKVNAKTESTFKKSMHLSAPSERVG